MIGKLVKALLAGSWGDDGTYPEDQVVANVGAPDFPEFRLSEDGNQTAVWVEPKQCWLVFRHVVVIRELHAVDPAAIRDWRVFREVEYED